MVFLASSGFVLGHHSTESPVFSRCPPGEKSRAGARGLLRSFVACQRGRMTAFTVPPFTVPVMVALLLLPVMVSLSPSREM